MPKIFSIKTYFGFQGRMTRSSFWSALAMTLVSSFILVQLALWFSGLSNLIANINPEDTSAGDGKRAILFVGVALLLTTVPLTAIVCKRIHDHGRSGRWSLVFAAPHIFSGCFFWLFLVQKMFPSEGQ
jgi:uncharacterized membrane protein YhaH (DUF805 family)